MASAADARGLSSTATANGRYLLPPDPEAASPSLHPSPNSKVAASFSIGQFNALAANLATPDHFPYATAKHLGWADRSRVLRNEICSMVPGDDGAAPPDVLCVEEVAQLPYFAAFMEPMGFKWISARRPSEHESSWSGLAKEDGTAIFYNTARFSLVHAQAIVFDDVHDRVGLAALLADTVSSDLLLVASTHLYWNAAKLETQLAELAEFEGLVVDVMRKLAAVVRGDDAQSLAGVALPDHNHVLAAADGINLGRTSLVGTGASAAAELPSAARERLSDVASAGALDDGVRALFQHVPVVVAGDFNNGPDSAVYARMVSDFLEPWLPLPLVSAYAQYPGVGGAGEPPFTTYNYKRSWTIDYIFHTPASTSQANGLELDGLLSLPNIEAVTRDDGPPGWRDALSSPATLAKYPRLSELAHTPRLLNGIPNSLFGSDHVPLVAVFHKPL
ncbi:uncharacterized protein AMSG_02086 [Thecamonas trahens ATCC 50062]|uniref:Endonuclease/exonuclease/phosphatase domain-containing protein n=1 Tax=Thecamonas trahens ATCC 50062 TaxID=461836 RepID=A0A0L0DUV8_THETB|nr:hypothetical protein AMSG_02086 [Thecamonas trahens ATCC 50062]KNC56074.1 hypothetical protein AMSG_02086 [Thecamonas trahens ATCC 50062]|eukprot:XP_013761118.1 hypothetical protein AMSG_02086 [Thecamonas trahens ATCC 50062]